MGNILYKVEQQYYFLDVVVELECVIYKTVYFLDVILPLVEQLTVVFFGM